VRPDSARHGGRPAIEVDGLVKRYGTRGATRAVLDGVTFAVPSGSLTCLLGPSGSGKSTILGCLAGLIEPDAGAITLGGRSMHRVPPHRRPVTLLMQTAQLFGFLSVADNIGFGLKVRGVATDQRLRRIEELLGLVGLDGMGPRGTAGLSGGEQQRVALARALAIEPEVLLLDEPLANLDPPVRRELQDLLVALHHRTASTMVLVTHDVSEALALGEQIVVLDDGRVAAAGPPSELYRHPPTLSVARMLGIETVLEGRLHDGVLAGPWGAVPVDAAHARGPVTGGRSSTWVIRPEHIELVEPAATPDLMAMVESVRYAGATVELRLRTADGTRITVTVPATVPAPPAGQPVAVRLPAGSLVEVSD
jgi:thiamine transport system ATP-binding protein